MARINIKGTIVSDDDKWIYDWFGIKAVCPADIHKAIENAEGEELEVEINSGGGDVIAGNEIYTALRQYKGKVMITISGMAMSAASYIATARRCQMTPVGIFMIHNASGGARGDYHVMDKESEILQTINRAITAAYAEKTNMSQEELLDLMDKESWLTAEEALNYGFIDSIMESQEQPLKKADKKSAFFNGQKPAIYNAVTVLDRETIEKAKKMLGKTSEESENTTSGRELPDSVLNSIAIKNIKEETKMEESEKISTVEELTAKYPALVQQIKESAALEATNAENARLKAIDEIAGQISDEMVMKAKYGERKIAAEALALEAFKANGIMAAVTLSNMKQDINESGTSEITPTANVGFADSVESAEEQEVKVRNLAEIFKRKRR